MKPIVKRLARVDETVAPELVRLINRAYARGEAGLWREDLGRTDETEIAEAIGAGQMFVATVGDRIVGCLRARALDATTADVGLIGVGPDAWGSGIGRARQRGGEPRALPRRHHDAARAPRPANGNAPRQGTPARLVHAPWLHHRPHGPFEDVIAHAAPLLNAPGDVLIFTKTHPLTN